MKRFLLSFFVLFSIFTGFSQNTSPLVVKDFMLQTNGIMDIEQVPKNARTDWDNNPVCMIQVKAVGFDENLMQKFVFVPNGIDITHKTIKDGMVILYISSNKIGEITIKHMGDCRFTLPYKLEGHKIYALTLGMETATLVVKSVPVEAVIFIDNEKVGTGYASKAVSIGVEHRYKVVFDDFYYPKEGIIYFDKRDEKEVVVELEPNFGYITIKTDPASADVYIDDKKVGVTPYNVKKIKKGEHTIELRKQGYFPFADVVTINVGDKNKDFENVILEKDENTEQQPVQMTSVNESPDINNDFEFKTFSVNGVSFEMVVVEGGTFTMGGTSEQGSDAFDSEIPTHDVTLSDYYIGKYEVTQELWKAVMGNNPSLFIGKNLPVEKVSWNDVQEFIKKINQKTGIVFRLPTEAEWEYAARGGNKSKGYKYSGSNNIGEVAWYYENSGRKAHPVGAKLPNELGIYDMCGNVWEWCQDWFDSYHSGKETNPTGPSEGYYRVRRGGGWDSYAGNCRVSNRLDSDANNSYSNLGFRLVLVP